MAQILQETSISDFGTGTLTNVTPGDSLKLAYWTEENYDDSGWASAVELVPNPDWASISEDSGAKWIWNSSGAPTYAPDGDCYFRKTFSVTTERTATIKALADDYMDLYLDGELVISCHCSEACFLQVRSTGVSLSSGDHIITAKVTNKVLPGDNAAGFCLTIIDSSSNILVHTDSSWSILAYPSSTPGYASSGNRVSPEYDISSVGELDGYLAVSWDETKPSGTSITIQANISLDGINWEGWETCHNNSALSAVSDGTDLSSAKIQFKESLATSDTSQTPQLNSLVLSESSLYGSAPVIENYEVPSSVLSGYSFEVSAIVTDADGDLDEVYFQFNGTDYPAYQAGSQFRKTLYAPSVSSNTDYNVTIVAKDAAYNETSQTQSITVLGSAHAPSFSNISIPSEVDEGKTFNISVVVIDADGDLSTVKVTWNGSTDSMSASGSTYSKALTAPSVSEDTIYSCLIVATDAAGNTATLIYSINVRNIRAVDIYSYIDICCNKYVSQGEVYAIRTDGRLFTIENNVSPTAVALPSGSDGWSVKQVACGDEFQLVRAEVLWSS